MVGFVLLLLDQHERNYMGIKKLVVHYHLPDSRVVLAEIVQRLSNLATQGERLMTTVTDIQASLQAIADAAAAEKAEVAAALQTLSDQIAALQAAIDGGAGVTSADLDGLKATADALVAQVQGINP